MKEWGKSALILLIAASWSNSHEETIVPTLSNCVMLCLLYNFLFTYTNNIQDDAGYFHMVITIFR